LQGIEAVVSASSDASGLLAGELEEFIMRAWLNVFILALVALTRGVPVAAQAQLGTGAIAGVILDSRDAAVPGARVRVIHAPQIKSLKFGNHEPTSDP
jgi:hypothetical protein